MILVGILQDEKSNFGVGIDGSHSEYFDEPFCDGVYWSKVIQNGSH